jgi:hypothetical protein
MIEIRLEYGGMRATNARDSFESAMVEARRMLDAHGITDVRHRAPRNDRHIAEITGRSYAGSRALLYMFDA